MCEIQVKRRMSPRLLDEFTATYEEPAKNQGAKNAVHPLFAGSSSNLYSGRTAMDEEARKHP
jgi:hypothetical protein